MALYKIWLSYLTIQALGGGGHYRLPYSDNISRPYWPPHPLILVTIGGWTSEAPLSLTHAANLNFVCALKSRRTNESLHYSKSVVGLCSWECSGYLKKLKMCAWPISAVAHNIQCNSSKKNAHLIFTSYLIRNKKTAWGKHVDQSLVFLLVLKVLCKLVKLKAMSHVKKRTSAA